MYARLAQLVWASSFLSLLVGLSDCRKCVAQTHESTRIEISLDPKVASEPIDGRLFVFFSEGNRRAPRGTIEWFSPEPFVAVDVSKFSPGEKRTVEAKTSGFPGNLSELPQGKYYVHALLAHSVYDGDPGRAEGNLFCQPIQREVNSGQSTTIELVLDQVVPDKRPNLQLWMEQIEVPCPMLGEFHGREHLEPAMVILPPSYSTFPDRRFAVMYCIPSFNVTHLDSRHWQQLTGPREAQGNEVEFIRVVLNGQGPWGHHSYANSATNGPRADSLVQELVPYIDEHYRTVAQPTARFLTGHSSGGWSSLWLQIMYPETFGGVWSSAPDPVDFRSYQGVSLYADVPENVYITADGERRRLSRQYRDGFIYWDSFTRMDDAYGRGGQLRAFEAVFSPLDKQGKPERVFDRETGLVNRQVAEQWKRFDIRHVLQDNWALLKPKLAGKIHLLVGTQDTFFLEEAVHHLCDTITDFEDIAEVEFLEGRSHLNTLTEARYRRLRQQLSDTFLKHHRDAYWGEAKRETTSSPDDTITFVQNRIQASNGESLDLQESHERRTQHSIPYAVSDADIPDIAQLTGLQQLRMPRATQLTDDAIAGLRNLRELVDLDLSGTALTDAAAGHLATFPKLEKLNLSGTKLGDAGAEELGELKSLKDLNLRNTQITSASLQHLAKLPHLTILDISATQVDRNGFEILSACESLEILRVQATWITEQDIQPLLQHASLKELDVSGTLISPGDLERLQRQLTARGSSLQLIQTYSPFTVDKTRAGSPVVQARFPVNQSAGPFSDRYLPSLIRHLQMTELDLRGSQISEAGLAKLSSVADWQHSLRKLNLQNTAVSTNNLERFKQFQNLVELKLLGTALGDATDVLPDLSRSGYLSLENCDVTDLGVAKLQGMQQLDYLSLTNCRKVTDLSVPYLRTLRGLRYLYIRGTSISPDGVRALQEELPACFVYGDRRRWEYRWPNPQAPTAADPIVNLPPVRSTARVGRILIDSRRCDQSWWMSQQPASFDPTRDFHARSAWNMLRQQGYDVELIKPGEKMQLDELSTFNVLVRQRPWVAEEQAESVQAYRRAVENGSLLFLELSPGYEGDSLASSWGISAQALQSARSVVSYRDEPLGRSLQYHTGPFCELACSNPKVKWLAWLDEERQRPVAGSLDYGQGKIFFVGGPLIDADRVGPIVQVINDSLDPSLQRESDSKVILAERPHGPSVEQLASPAAEELLPQPGSSYWRFQCIPPAGVQTSQVVVHGPLTVSLLTREADFRDREHIHNLRLSNVKSIPREQAGRWFWQARVCSVSGEWGPWSEAREMRFTPTPEEAAAALPPQPEAPDVVPGMRVLPIAGARVQFLGGDSYIALSTIQGVCHVYYLDASELQLVTDQFLSSGFGSVPFMFGNKKWLAHLQPQTDGQADPLAVARNRNARRQPLLMQLDEKGQVLRTLELQHADSVTANYVALGRWLVTRAREDNRVWDLSSEDPTANTMTIESPQNQQRMEPFKVDGRWLLAGDQLIDLEADDPLQRVRQLPSDSALGVSFSSSDRWLVKGRILVDLQHVDWDSAVKVLPAVAETNSMRFSRDEKWLLNGPWLIDLTASDPANSALRLGIDDRMNTEAFSPDGRWLFATSPAKIQLWDLHADDIGGSMRETEGPGGGGYGFGPADAANVAFSPDHRWATVTSYAGKTLVFDLSSQQLKPHIILDKQDSYQSLNWSNNSRWLIFGDHNGLSIADLQAHDPQQTTRTLAEVGGAGVRGLGPIRVSPNKRWLCFSRHRNFNSDNPAIKLWDLEVDDPLTSEIELPVPQGFNGVFSSDSRLLAIPSLRVPGSGRDYQSSEDLILFDLSQPDVAGSELRLPTHQHSAREIRFSSDGRWLVTSDSTETRVYEIAALLRR